MVSVNIRSVDTSGGTVTVRTGVTATGDRPNQTYELTVRDSATGTVETFNDAIGPGAVNIHTLTFSPTNRTAGEVTAEVIGEDFDQATWEVELFDPGAVAITGCNLVDTDVNRGETVTLDFNVSNDNEAIATFDYEVAVGGSRVTTGRNNIFGGSTQTFGATFTARESGNVTVNLTNVEER